MYLHKTSGTIASETVSKAAGKTATEPSAQNVQSGAPAAKSSVSAQAVPRSITSLITAAGLPVDKLSASIISFARFFSLSLKPELMAAIRRQALTSAAAAQSELAKHTAADITPNIGAAVKSREALSLAAAAAESKGVELNGKGLEMLAEAIDPEQKRQDHGEHNQRGRRNKKENAPLKTGSISASVLKETALDSAEKDTLLRILNRIPGKNGQRWIVLPFDFNENDREFRVSMRILLETEHSSNRAVCMALDIAESGGTDNSTGSSIPEKRWLFVLDSVNGQINKLTVYLKPELPQRAQSLTARELANLLQIEQERISIRKMTESFPCETGYAEQLRSIDEAV